MVDWKMQGELFSLFLTNASECNVDAFSLTTEKFYFYGRNLQISFANRNLATSIGAPMTFKNNTLLRLVVKF